MKVFENEEKSWKSEDRSYNSNLPTAYMFKGYSQSPITNR